MKVDQEEDLGNGHRIEIGEATWGGGDRSVRNRFETSTGGFSPHSSSEIPMHDLVPILQFIAQHDELSIAECAEIVSALSASIRRQCL
jgi:hypothetical protein